MFAIPGSTVGLFIHSSVSFLSGGFYGSSSPEPFFPGSLTTPLFRKTTPPPNVSPYFSARRSLSMEVEQTSNNPTTEDLSDFMPNPKFRFQTFILCMPNLVPILFYVYRIWFQTLFCVDRIWFQTLHYVCLIRFQTFNYVCQIRFQTFKYMPNIQVPNVYIM